MMGERGVSVDHSTIYRWVQKYAPEIEKRLPWRCVPGVFPRGMSVRNELDPLMVHSNCSHSNYSFEMIPSIIDTEGVFLRVRIT